MQFTSLDNDKYILYDSQDIELATDLKNYFLNN